MSEEALHTLAGGGDRPDLRVLFAPYMPSNPYQRLLAGGLDGQGMEVLGVEAFGDTPSSLAKSLGRLRPAVLHLHWLHPYFARAGAITSIAHAARFLRTLRREKARGTRIVWSAHNLANHEGDQPRLDAYVTRSVARLADAIIAHGPTAKARVVAFVGNDVAANTVVIPLGHNLDEYPNTLTRHEARARLAIDPDTFVVLFFGRIRPYKGVFELMDAFARADLPANSLLLIAGKSLGEGPRVSLKRRCRKSSRVRLDHGYIEDDRVQEYMNAADVTALPYRDILTSSAVNLNMSFGTSIIAPRVGCITDTLDDGGGFLYDPDDDEGLVKGLEEAARTKTAAPDELRRQGERNRRRIAEWTWSRVGQLTAATYRPT